MGKTKMTYHPIAGRILYGSIPNSVDVLHNIIKQ